MKNDFSGSKSSAGVGYCMIFGHSTVKNTQMSQWMESSVSVANLQIIIFQTDRLTLADKTRLARWSISNNMLVSMRCRYCKLLRLADRMLPAFVKRQVLAVRELWRSAVLRA